MTITKTKMNPYNSPINYMAYQKVEGLREPVCAIAPTRSSAIAICNIKVEVAVNKVARMIKRPLTRKLNARCMCGGGS